MITLDQAVHTERVITEAIARFTDYGDYLVYKSDEFPSYYAGNGLRLISRNRSLGEWEAIFESHFDPKVYVHKMFTFNDHPGFESVIEEAISSDYNFERGVWMACQEPPVLRPIPGGSKLVRIRAESDWDKLAAFLLESYKEYDWFDPTYEGPDRLYEKMRVAAERLDVRWFALENDSGIFVSKAGYFVLDRVARLQDVGTRLTERRKGFVSTLLTHIMHDAFGRGVEAVVLTTDVNYYAKSAYEKLGFEPLGHTIELMKYPRHQKL